MKKGLIVFFLLLLMVVPSFAQEEDNGLVVFGGGNYTFGAVTDTSGFLWNFGVGLKLSGPIWVFGSADIGEYQSIMAQISLQLPLKQNLFKEGDQLSIGILAGPAGDETPEDIWRLAGVAGGMLIYEFSDYTGLLLHVKYKFELDEAGTYYKNGFILGINFMFGLL